jgi:K+-sensing histidine kinase KdpD
MTTPAPPLFRYVTVSSSPERSRLSCAAYGLVLGALSVALQRLLAPFLGPDSYQLLLSAVAVGVMYAGVWAGASALLVTGLAKLILFLPAESSLHLSDVRLLLRFGLFLSLGLLICWLGQKLHASRRKLRVLSGLLPICAWCKRVRDEKEQWQPLQSYIHDHSEADFTHGMCPDCARELVN